jgi:hypothetical protein
LSSLAQYGPFHEFLVGAYSEANGWEDDVHLLGHSSQLRPIFIFMAILCVLIGGILA